MIIRIILLFISIVIVFQTNPLSADNQEQELFCITINTESNEISINENRITNFNLSTLKQIIGHPDRIQIENIMVDVTEYPYDDNDVPYYYTQEVTNYYYIYDNLGLVFHTANNLSINNNPVYLKIFYDSKREFTHMKLPEFLPEKTFQGVLKINDIILEPHNQIISEEIKYNTKYFTLFNTTFAPTSIATVIDSIYSYEGNPYIQIFLNNGIDKKVSYISIRFRAQ